MEVSVGSTIEKIIIQEQDKENKLKSKRELEATLASMNKSIRETLLQIDQFKRERDELINKTDKLRFETKLGKIKLNALAEQITACNQEIVELRKKSDDGVTQVWETRSALTKEIQNISDKCDVWALLIKPVCSKPLPRAIQFYKNNSEINLSENEQRLKKAQERKENAITTRNRLLTEPETGEEFLRIKNALKYSLEMIANLQK